MLNTFIFYFIIGYKGNSNIRLKIKDVSKLFFIYNHENLNRRFMCPQRVTKVTKRGFQKFEVSRNFELVGKPILGYRSQEMTVRICGEVFLIVSVLLLTEL